jgi:hypothetical protein
MMSTIFIGTLLPLFSYFIILSTHTALLKFLILEIFKNKYVNKNGSIIVICYFCFRKKQQTQKKLKRTKMVTVDYIEEVGEEVEAEGNLFLLIF